MSSKTCKKCGKTRTEDRFETYDNGYGPRQRTACKDCRNTKMRGTRKESSRRYYEANREKLLEKHRKYYSENKDIVSKRSRKYYKENRELVRAKVASKTYGISVEEVLELRQKPCGICGSDGDEYKLSNHIDHCHATGKVRGVLCHSCNIALGLLKEDPKLLDKMKEYIHEHQ